MLAPFVLAYAPLAPVAPEGAYLSLGLVVVVSFVVAVGLKWGWDNSLGALFGNIAKALRHVRFVGGALARPFEAIEHDVGDALGRWALANETALGKWWYAQKALVEWTADTVAEFALSSVAAMHSLVHGTIPSAIGSAVKPVKNDVGALRRALRAETRTLERTLVRKAHALEVELERDFGKAWRGIDHLRGVSIPRIWRWAALAGASIAALRRYAHGILNRRLSRLEKLILGGALTAAVLRVLTRYWPYWRCTNVRRFNKGLCRLPIGGLDWLFALTFEAFVVADLCDFITALSAAAKKAEPVLLGFVSVEDALLGCPNASYPPTLPGYAIDLPPAQQRAALPGGGL